MINLQLEIVRLFFRITPYQQFFEGFRESMAQDFEGPLLRRQLFQWRWFNPAWTAKSLHEILSSDEFLGPGTRTVDPQRPEVQRGRRHHQRVVWVDRAGVDIEPRRAPRRARGKRDAGRETSREAEHRRGVGHRLLRRFLMVPHRPALRRRCRVRR